MILSNHERPKSYPNLCNDSPYCYKTSQIPQFQLDHPWENLSQTSCEYAEAGISRANDLVMCLGPLFPLHLCIVLRWLNYKGQARSAAAWLVTASSVQHAVVAVRSKLWLAGATSTTSTQVFSSGSKPYLEISTLIKCVWWSE